MRILPSKSWPFVINASRMTSVDISTTQGIGPEELMSCIAAVTSSALCHVQIATQLVERLIGNLVSDILFLAVAIC